MEEEPRKLRSIVVLPSNALARRRLSLRSRLYVELHRIVLEELLVALRTMLPSLAKVGDTIHFSFPRDRLAGKPISAFEVVVNGKKIHQPEVLITRAGRGGTESANFVFKVTEPGVFWFEITPIAGGEKGPARLNTLEVSL